MKIIVVDDVEKIFQPIKIQLTLESKEEAENLLKGLTSFDYTYLHLCTLIKEELKLRK